ncbi:hypothetical protein [Leisingera sp. JC11]|uniref:hypothetical protein n=1 Tax=Leisingera sp. JC11 TaxID=3042469 RepID=UPI0034557FEF
MSEYRVMLPPAEQRLLFGNDNGNDNGLAALLEKINKAGGGGICSGKLAGGPARGCRSGAGSAGF